MPHDLSRAVTALNGKHTALSRYFDYYDGTAALPYLSRRLRELYGPLDITVTENWCAVVIDALWDRIVLDGFTSDDERAYTILNDLVGQTDLLLEADDAHQAALIAGEAYFVVEDADEQLAVFYNDPRRCHVFYDTRKPTTRTLACKWWDDEEGSRHLMLYTAAEIAEYTAKKRPGGSGYEASSFTLVDAQPNPFGQIPVFHLRPNMRATRSELERVIPLQNMVDTQLINMLVTSEFAAAPLKYIITNAEGIDDLTVAPNRIWHVPSGDGLGGTTTIGQLPAADLHGYMSAIDHLINALVSISRTPRHYFFGAQNPPSGEALQALEAPLIKKATSRMARFTVTYQKLAAFLCQLRGHTIAPQQIHPHWQPPETAQPLEVARTREAEANAVLARREVGISRREGLRELNFSEDKIDAMAAEEDSTSADAGAQLLGALNKGL